MIRNLTRANAQVVLNAAYHQLVTGKRQRFTFWKQNANGHTWTMYKMKRNSRGIFWATWEWANSWEGYTERRNYQLADKNYQPLDYRYSYEFLNGWDKRPTRIEDLVLSMKTNCL